MGKKVLLMILDGWGHGKHDKADAIFNAQPEFMNSLEAKCPNAELRTSGEDVGLPEGQMGNSEVGHLNIGAGRVVYQDLVKINIACRDNSILQNPEIVKAYSYAKENGKQIHLMGLVSDGGVHSSMDHLFKLIEISKEYGIDKTFVHAFMDGRDTDPKSGKGFIEALEAHIAKNTGALATMIGRYYAMDRDKRWERVKESYDLMVHGTGTPTTNMVEAVQQSYDAGVTDEFIKPAVKVDAAGKPVATIQEGDVVIFFNFRNDRAKELTIVLTQKDMPEAGMKTIPLHYCTMTPYDATFEGMHILFDKDNVTNTLGEVVAKAGKKQIRIAETEKYAHVTFFFSGGREKEFENESRILIPSPKVATYDLQPEMSAFGVKDAIVAELNKGEVDFVALNYANGDMVGHTGDTTAITKAIKAVDQCVKETVEAAVANGYTVLITADHGNADNAVNEDGSPNTAHSLNPVPFIVIDKDIKSVKNGKLADIAPTILKLMDIPAPAEMTGTPLV